MAKRVQSPSSIKLYQQCPRKYYYQYIQKLKTLPSIHLVRGNVAHTVLEKFFDTDISDYTMDNFKVKLSNVLQELLLQEWAAAKNRLTVLRLTSEQYQFYFEETLLMLFNWLDQFANEVTYQHGTFQERFKILTPIREKYYLSKVFNVRGYIDAIENINDEIRVMDYKTSKSFGISDHKLQLAIYALLYQEVHGVLPHKVGVYFLKDKPKVIKVDEQLVEFAKKEIELVHQNTVSEEIADYPKKKSGLCKYSTGQCDFFDTCQKEE
ncbi:PD-(D/E)XK nuclease family protein [Candidatus Woesearchaeota archaeon]|nr:PD-(D/E)XK nuclease family protein [Candidatus Woesearchaeota archaeon]MBW2994339.1 PD-(D/E)XK nuclease family protein [Candidatus Woesearchaeota archaeon]